MCAASGTRTRTAITGQGILSPSCLPIPPLRRPVSFVFDVLIKNGSISATRPNKNNQTVLKERQTGLEPATPTLARLCSTN